MFHRACSKKMTEFLDGAMAQTAEYVSRGFSSICVLRLGGGQMMAGIAKKVGWQVRRWLSVCCWKGMGFSFAFLCAAAGRARVV